VDLKQRNYSTYSAQMPQLVSTSQNIANSHQVSDRLKLPDGIE